MMSLSPHRWWIALAAILPVSAAGTAWACGELPLPTFGFAATQPDASGQAFPRDASIVLHLGCSVSSTEAPIVQAASCHLSPLGARVSLHAAASGADVPGRLVVRPEALIFLPTAPLAANSDYTVMAELGPQGTGEPSPTFSTSLRTSDGLLAPFVSATPPSIVSEWYDAPVTQCDDAKLVGQAALDVLAPSICPSFHNNCRADGTQRMLRLHASFGPLMGGSSALPYTGQLKLSSGGPSSFEGDEGAAPASPPENTNPPPAGVVVGATYATAPAGSSIDLFVDLLPPDDSTTKLCVRARAFEAAGQVLYTPDHCDTYVGWMTDAQWTAEAASEDTARADAGGAPHADISDAATPISAGGVDAGLGAGSPRHDGCSLGAGANAFDSSSVAWLGVVVGGSLRSRRRRATS